MFHTIQCKMSSSFFCGRGSMSWTIRAKLLVPLGAFIHCRGGDTASVPAAQVNCCGSSEPSTISGLMMRNGDGGAPPRPPAPGPAGGAPAAGGACCASKRPALAIERRTAAATNEAILRMPFFSFSSVIDVGGAGVGGRLIVLLAVDALGGAIFLWRAGGE